MVLFYSEAPEYVTKVELKTNATFKYDHDPKTNKSILICCSNSSRAPQLYHGYCNHPITCAFRNKFVTKTDYVSPMILIVET